jgi:hypothetical protein
VPGGGVDAKEQLHKARSKGKFLFPVKAMSIVFRAKYLAEIRKRLKEKVPQRLLNILYNKD